jgi:two-component system sensor histidine kinase DegS
MIIMESPVDVQRNPWEEFPQDLQNEIEQARRSISEISLMLEQSQSELAKLTQRNSAINGHLQQVQAQFETMPRSDIRNAYTAALDVQQRLLVMRGQLEKLQSDQNNLKHSVQIMEKIQGFVSEYAPTPKTGRGGKNAAATLEMVINAQEAVRQRLSTQMHNGPAQALTNFILQLDIAVRCFDMDPAKSKEELGNMRAAAMGTFQKVKGFISELRPMMLDDLGLFPTIQKYVKDYRDQSNLDVTLTIKGQERRLEPYLEVMIFRAVQELIENASRHNQESPVKVQMSLMISIEDNFLKVIATDNGKGFDPDILVQSNGLGLKLIRERVEILGGSFEVDSAPGKGTRISFQVPSGDFTKIL